MKPPFAAWTPKSVLALRHYDLETFRHDAVAGLTVGFVALPLAMAFAIASGLTPQAGLYCAVVTGFTISALGGSRVQIGGPTGAFVVVVAGIVAKYGVAGMYMCTMMAGVILVLMGLTKTGSAIRFVPRPVVVGFTNGIAVLIASTQIADFLGLSMQENPGDFIGRLQAIGQHLHTVTPAADRPRPLHPLHRHRHEQVRHRRPRLDCRARGRDGRRVDRSTCRSRPLRRALAACPPGCQRCRRRHSILR